MKPRGISVGISNSYRSLGSNTHEVSYAKLNVYYRLLEVDTATGISEYPVGILAASPQNSTGTNNGNTGRYDLKSYL